MYPIYLNYENIYVPIAGSSELVEVLEIVWVSLGLWLGFSRWCVRRGRGGEGEMEGIGIDGFDMCRANGRD